MGITHYSSDNKIGMCSDFPPQAKLGAIVLHAEPLYNKSRLLANHSFAKFTQSKVSPSLRSSMTEPAGNSITYLEGIIGKKTSG